MEYIKQQWENGEVITADKLNHMEEGIHGSNLFRSTQLPLIGDKTMYIARMGDVHQITFSNATFASFKEGTFFNMLSSLGAYEKPRIQTKNVVWVNVGGNRFLGVMTINTDGKFLVSYMKTYGTSEVVSVPDSAIIQGTIVYV